MFIRFVNSEEHAIADFERGFSYRLYQFFDSESEAAESDLAQWYGVSLDTLAPAPWPGQWGFALDGLCGFEVEADTVEEAVEEARRRGGYNCNEWPFVAVFNGEYLGEADGGDGDVFRPTKLLAVVEWKLGMHLLEHRD